MFKDKKDLADVAIALDKRCRHRPEVILKTIYGCQEWGVWVNMHNELKGKDFELFVHLFRRIKREGLDKQGITELLETQNRPFGLRDKQVDLNNNHIWHLHSKKVQLEKEIDELRTKIDNFDGVSSL